MPAAAPGVTPPTAKFHLGYVDGLRAVAALVVYVNHAYAQTWNPLVHSYAEGTFAFAQYSLVAGHLAVTVFIVVSGFCLGLPIAAGGGTLRGGAREFFKRRARRILPPYYAALALCLALIATVLGQWTLTIWDVPTQVKPASIVAHLALLQDLFGTGHINYVFWSIAVEWHIYFFVPLFAWAWRRWGSWVVLMALAIGYALRVGFGDTRLERAHPQYLGMFALGLLAAYVLRAQDGTLQRLRERFPFDKAFLLAFALVVVLVGTWGIGTSVGRFYLLDLPVGVMTTCLLIAAAKPSSILGKFLSFRPLVLLGTFSYSLYLIHAPLLQILWQYVLGPLKDNKNLTFVSLMTGGLVATVGASYLFHLAFEAPFMKSPGANRRVAVVAAGGTPSP